jgi:hypothetical protein
VNAIPTLHHLEIVALRERLTSRLRELNLRVPELPRLEAHHLEALSALIESNAVANTVLNAGAQRLRAGRAWLVGVLLSLIVALRDDTNENETPDHATLSRDDVLECQEARGLRSNVHTRLPNRALRFNKSCVLWARYLS